MPESANARRTTRGRGLGVRVLVVALVLGAGTGLAVTPAVAAGPAACPSAAVPATPFTDTVRSPHRAAIDCLTWWDLTTGRSATSYGAGDRITRGQTAAMIARLLDRTGDVPSEVPSADFQDTVGHQFATEIDLLDHLGIVQGHSDTRFAPDATTTRAQMATVLVNTLELVLQVDLPAGTVPFLDVPRDHLHRGPIGKLVGSGVVTGTSAIAYDPAGRVSREQMASFLTRGISLLVDDDGLELPDERPAPADPYASAVRGTWVHLFDETLKSRASIAAMVDELAAADINTVVVQVARRHDAYYASEVLPATLDPQLEDGLDVLEELLPLAAAHDIDVHAWISVAPSWHGVYEDLGIAPSQLGADVAWRTRTVDGLRSEYLDPGLTEVQDHVAAIVGELAADYPLDGIHLDYVRYQSNRHGYHPAALERFRDETSVTGTPAPTDAAWAAWRRSQTREIFTRARQAIDATNPDVELSAAAISWGEGPPTPDRAGFRATRSYTDVLQDWDRLARDERLDAVMPMNYYRANDSWQAAGLQRWLRHERALAAETDVRIVPGLAGYLNAPDAALRQVHAGLQHGDGALVYSYQQPTLDNSRGIWERLAATRWGYPPPAP